ncbi:MAG: hypothetical protein H7A50_05405 [Akkermansiaceae bacterium]|nr:hypothetical protein [Akkermansiaceae bacterium]
MSESPSTPAPAIALALLLVLGVVASFFLLRSPRTSEGAPSPLPETPPRTSSAPDLPERKPMTRAAGSAVETASETEPVIVPEEVPEWFPVPPGAKDLELVDHSLRSDGLREGKVVFRVEGDAGEARVWIARRLAAHAMTPTRPGAFASSDAKRTLTIASSGDDDDRLQLEYGDMGEGCQCPTCKGEAP